MHSIYIYIYIYSHSHTLCIHARIDIDRDNENNAPSYLLAVSREGPNSDELGLSWYDINTGEFQLGGSTISTLANDIVRYEADLYNAGEISSNKNIFLFPPLYFECEFNTSLCHLGANELKISLPWKYLSIYQNRPLGNFVHA